MLTIEETTKTIEMVVDRAGKDYVYPQQSGGVCVYTNSDGTPSCIVGHVLSHLEPQLLEQLCELEHVAGDAVSVCVLDVDMEPGVREALQVAQEVQDEGATWGEALAAYHEALEGFRMDPENFRYRPIIEKYVGMK